MKKAKTDSPMRYEGLECDPIQIASISQIDYSISEAEITQLVNCIEAVAQNIEDHKEEHDERCKTDADTCKACRFYRDMERQVERATSAAEAIAVKLRIARMSAVQSPAPPSGVAKGSQGITE